MAVLSTGTGHVYTYGYDPYKWDDASIRKEWPIKEETKEEAISKETMVELMKMWQEKLYGELYEKMKLDLETNLLYRNIPHDVIRQADPQWTYVTEQIGNMWNPGRVQQIQDTANRRIALLETAIYELTSKLGQYELDKELHRGELVEKVEPVPTVGSDEVHINLPF